MKQTGLLFVCLFYFSVYGVAQTPTPIPEYETTERIVTEEIKLNVAALDRGGKFVADVRKEDLVIMEDGRLHQADSVRFVPASVLIAMDTGGEIRQKKNIATTRSVAESLVGNLRDGTSIALMQFHEKIEFLSSWSTDKSELLNIIGSRTNFGRRSSFTAAILSASEFFQKTPLENRHLILITDGLDTVKDDESRASAIRKLWESGIVVHVISYTQIEYGALKPQAKIWRKGEQNPRRMPDEAMESLAHALPVKQIEAKEILKTIYQPRLFSIIIDRPLIKHRKEHLKSLGVSQIQLAALAVYTGGEFLLPETLAEIVDQAAGVSRIINSQYVVTYSPKRSLIGAEADEIREIDVSSRRPDLDVRASRRLIVFAGKQK